jgi:hypothetical protein
MQLGQHPLEHGFLVNQLKMLLRQLVGFLIIQLMQLFEHRQVASVGLECGTFFNVLAVSF